MQRLPDGLVFDTDASLIGDTATAVFSTDRTYRYALTRRWDPTLPLTAWIMLNPSTADAFQDDPTIRRCISFTKAWHAGGILVVNLFGLRATDPQELRTHPDPIGTLNDQVIGWWWSAYCPYAISSVIAAWGAHSAMRGRDQAVVHLLESLRSGTPVSCLGVTKDGHPRHPLYVPASAAPIEYLRAVA